MGLDHTYKVNEYSFRWIKNKSIFIIGNLNFIPENVVKRHGNANRLMESFLPLGYVAGPLHWQCGIHGYGEPHHNIATVAFFLDVIEEIYIKDASLFIHLKKNLPCTYGRNWGLP